MIVRVLDDQAQGDAGNVALGIRFAVDHGARVVNLSLAGPDPDPQLRDAIAYAGQAGVLVVTAAGNAAVNNDTTPTYPASFAMPNLISVAATGSDGRLGGESDYGTSVSIAAPGNAIQSTAMNGRVEWRTGTSMASPTVVGAIADLWSLRPRAPWQSVRDSLLVSAKRGLPVASGLLNMPAALAVLNGHPVTAAATSTATSTTSRKKSSTTPTKSVRKPVSSKRSSSHLRARSRLFTGA